MKKYRVLLWMAIGGCLLHPLNAAGQETGGLAMRFETPILGPDYQGFKALEFTADIGLNTTDWLAVFGRFDLSAGMFDIDGCKTYQYTNAAGVSCVFKAIKTKYGDVSVKLSGGATVSSEKWKYSYYVGGVYFDMGRDWIVKPTLGIGVKYYDTYKTSPFKDYLRFYLSFGLLMN